MSRIVYCFILAVGRRSFFKFSTVLDCFYEDEEHAEEVNWPSTLNQMVLYMGGNASPERISSHKIIWEETEAKIKGLTVPGRMITWISETLQAQMIQAIALSEKGNYKPRGVLFDLEMAVIVLVGTPLFEELPMYQILDFLRGLHGIEVTSKKILRFYSWKARRRYHVHSFVENRLYEPSVHELLRDDFVFKAFLLSNNFGPFLKFAILNWPYS